MFARTADAKLYYESTGSGQPVLLVSGLGMATTAWWRTVPVLARGLRVLAFDNRGVGRSDVTRGSYSRGGSARTSGSGCGIRSPAPATKPSSPPRGARHLTPSRQDHAPTLFLHGTEDRIVPVVNGVRLAEGIRGARLKVLRGAGHLYMTDAPQADRHVLRFLTRVATPRASRLRDVVRASRA